MLLAIAASPGSSVAAAPVMIECLFQPAGVTPVHPPTQSAARRYPRSPMPRAATGSRRRANTSSARRPTPRAPAPPRPRNRQSPSGRRCRFGKSQPRAPQASAIAKPDARQIHVTIGHRVIGDRHQSQHGRQHAQVPEPADKEVGAPPAPVTAAALTATKIADAPATFHVGGPPGGNG